MTGTSTRRTFLKRGATVAGVAGLGMVGTVGAGVAFPGASGSARFPESQCKGDGDATVLFAYASEFGTTGEVADAIATNLCRRGFSTETMRVEDVTDLTKYSAVVIGGAIQYDTWMTEAQHFLKKHEDALSAMPVAYFLTCLALAKKGNAGEAKADGYASKLEALSRHVKPVSVGEFAGALDFHRMSPLTVFAFRIGSLVLGIREGDYRDWNAIDAWADSLPFTANKN